MNVKELFFPKLNKDALENFVSINLGAFYLKVLIVKNGKIVDYCIERADQDTLAVLKKIWQNKSITTSVVKISVKNPSCLVRYFPFLKLDTKKLKDALFFELPKYIPYQPQEVYFDFANLGEKNQNEIFVLLAVAKKDFINQICEIFKKQNLKIHQITLDSVCLINLFLDKYKQNNQFNAVIVDIGYSSTTLTIVKKGIPMLTRDLAFNVQNIFRTLSNITDISKDDLEGWIFSLNNKNHLLELIQDDLISFCKELRNSFDYFEINNSESIDKIILTGGFSSVNFLRNFLKDILGVEVDLLDVSDKLASVQDDKLLKFINSFSVAVGLSL